MLVLKKIAITGGTASGKSLVCQIFKNLGVAYIVDSDEIVHRLLSHDITLRDQLVPLLGKEVVTDGKLDRKKIAEQVFSHPEKLQKLEKILHPLVIEEINNRYNQVKNSQNIPLFIVEIPLLYEIQGEDDYDAVVTVISEAALCEKRFTEKNQMKGQDFKNRMQRQLSPEKKAALADFVLTNNGSREELEENVKNLIPLLVA